MREVGQLMTTDEYVVGVLNKYAVPNGPNSRSENIGRTVASPIREWAGEMLEAMFYSGSYAKGTAVRGTSDVDVFISLKPQTTESLKEIYDKLFSLAERQHWAPRKQNVSIGVNVSGAQCDLVPGKVQEAYKNYHSLYLRKKDSWTQTNVVLHVDTVRKSGRLNEIRAIKIWRMLHKLDFPSLYLELFTIDALSGRSSSSLADNVIHVLRTIGASLSVTRIVDPSNTNNILSENLTVEEKQRIAAQAAQSARERSWGRIIW